MKEQENSQSREGRKQETLRRRIEELEEELSALREDNRELRENEQKYRLIANHSGDCLWIMDLETLRFTYVSPSVMQIYGSTPEETMAQGIDEVMPPHSQEIVMKILEEELAKEKTGADPQRTRTVEIEEYRQDRSIVWIENVLSLLRDNEGRPVAILGVSRDVTERKRLEDNLHKLAVTDPLTGTFNRRHFMDELHREMGRSDRYDIPFSLLMLDIDHFKAVNDRFGHETGDHVLKKLVQLIGERIRVSDVLARWGGEEFMIMLVSTTLPQAAYMAENLLEELRAHPFPEVGSLTVSLGVTQYRNRESSDALLTRVDNLMYQAKREGRARVVHDAGTESEGITC